MSTCTKDNKTTNLDRAISLCKEHAEKLKLPMKIIGADYCAKERKIIFKFESEQRVDFRELLKLLQTDLSVKIELRQVGPRDQVREIGGIGQCGRVCCCKLFLNDFKSISMKLIKEQGLQGNPQKFTGYCGKLMCCLRYESKEQMSSKDSSNQNLPKPQNDKK